MSGNGLWSVIQNDCITLFFWLKWQNILHIWVLSLIAQCTMYIIICRQSGHPNSFIKVRTGIRTSPKLAFNQWHEVRFHRICVNSWCSRRWLAFNMDFPSHSYESMVLISHLPTVDGLVPIPHSSQNLRTFGVVFSGVCPPPPPPPPPPSVGFGFSGALCTCLVPNCQFSTCLCWMLLTVAGGTPTHMIWLLVAGPCEFTQLSQAPIK